MSPLFCHRCGIELTPGRGDYYVIRIEAFSDPSSPAVSDEDLSRDFDAELQLLMEQMRDQSERELMDQVYRRLELTLCRACYVQWIERPVG